jgi:hypothetical protein
MEKILNKNKNIYFKAVDNFTDSCGDVIWTGEEKEEREKTREEYRQEIEELER